MNDQDKIASLQRDLANALGYEKEKQILLARHTDALDELYRRYHPVALTIPDIHQEKGDIDEATITLLRIAKAFLLQYRDFRLDVGRRIVRM